MARRTRFSAVLIFFLTGFVCACSDKTTPPSTSQRLIGRWRLVRIGQESISSLQVKEWVITFNSDHTWSYRGELMGILGGMRVDGAGHWHIRKNTLVYSAGDASGASVIHIDQDELTITPDPVLVHPVTHRPAATIYRRGPFA